MINKMLFFYYENKQTNKRAPKDVFRTSLLCLNLSFTTHRAEKSDGKLMLNNEGKHLKHKSSIKLCICAFISLDFNCSDLFNMCMMLNVYSVRIFSCCKNLTEIIIISKRTLFPSSVLNIFHFHLSSFKWFYFSLLNFNIF